MTELPRGMRQGPDWSVASEVLRMLPDEFVSVYTELWDAAYGSGSGPAMVPNNPRASVRYGGARLSSAGVEHVGSAPGRGKSDGTDTLRSQRAMYQKAWADRKLRKLTRDLKARLTPDVDNQGIRRCAGRCARYGEERWNYCPHCGGPMENVQ